MMIAQKSIQFLVGIFVFLASFTYAGEHKTEGQGAHEEGGKHEVHAAGPVDTKEEIDAYIKHHLQDAHDFTFFTDGETGKHYGFSLPIILWDNEAGLQVFSSSKFHHGEAVAESNGNFYKYYHGKIYKTDAEGTINYDEDHRVQNYRPLDFSVTKNVLGTVLAFLIVFLLFRSLAKSYAKSSVPSGLKGGLEELVIFVRDEIAIPNIGKEKHRKFMGYLLTVFFLILVLNLLGLTPLGFNVTGNIAVTMCLALFTFFITQFKGNKDYWKHIFWMPGAPVPMKIILAPIEVLGMFTKPFSLMVRLFANMTAGHSVLMALIALTILLKSQFTAVGSTGISVVLSLFIFLIELLVAYLQAFVFTMLSSLFIGVAVQDHHHDDHH
ncbi:MAG TPA: F0F1 ATP synthase subunit A [Taishania sp.]|nr:F0F1 ATP synthase subunit A [Taishania sp.]